MENFRNSSGTKTEKLKNWIFQRDPGRDSPYGFSFSVFLFFSFSVLLTELFRNISGDISEYLRETEKLKNWIFQRDPGRDSPYGFSFSVFQFFSFAYGTIPEYFRRHFGIFAEKLKNRKTEKLNFPERSRKRFSIWIQFFSFSVFQFFSFSVFLFFSFAYGTIPEYFRRHFGIFAEKLKNWKTEFSREVQEESLQRDSVFLFFSFSVFQFCLRNYSGIFPQTFRNICGETKKQKNWKTEFSREIQEEILHMDSVFQFFSFVAE